MKNPLHYQLFEYVDSYNGEGIMGKSGTSSAAMMFLSNWLNGFGKIGQLPVSSSYLSKEDVCIGRESRINDALCRGGVVVIRVLYGGGHYVLLTGIQDNGIRLFDPYYTKEEFSQEGIVRVDECPFAYNRIVDEKYFNRETEELYALGPVDDREAVIIFNEKTRKTAEATIEYFI